MVAYYPPITLTDDDSVVAAGAWACRVALFSAGLIVTAIGMHRLFGMPTLVALNIVKVAFAGAGTAILLGGVAFLQIWWQGRGGAFAAWVGVLIGLAIFAWPAFYIPTLATLPEINDVTTDPRAPPPFVALAKLRGAGANSAAYPGEAFARPQAAAYPDVRPFIVDRSAEETFELVAEAVRRLKLRVVSEQPPRARPGRPGMIEAVDRTLIVGFYDDVVIRVEGDQKRARIDVRSASRFGSHDLGRNASRVRKILKEVHARLEATVPAASGGRIVRLKPRPRKTAVPNRPKGGDQMSVTPRTAQDRVQSDAQRGLVQKAKPRL
jgi:uncharacterized protein (DUF1499 family)